MLTRALVAVALIMVIALPFAIRRTGERKRAADDTVVIVTPHNAAIRYEFERGFPSWYRAKTGRSVAIDWRVIGGTGDIARYLESTYASAFERQWTASHAGTWTPEIAATFQASRPSPEATVDAKRARESYLASDVSCGIDVFFGGDTYQAAKEAASGHFVPAGLETVHPDWFGDDAFPRRFGGQTFRDAEGRWYGVVLSSYGIIFNHDGGRRIEVAVPQSWSDLTNPRLIGQLALADPTKSGSMCEAFENILQQEMTREWRALAGNEPDPVAREARAVRDGWTAGLRLILRMAANARYFTDSSQKPLIDVATGDCVAGLCIDFYGRQQEEALRRRDVLNRVTFVKPAGGSAVSADPIGLLRGAPHRAVAVAFIEYALSLEGQRLWAYRPGAPGGPERYALRRAPVRRDFYGQDDGRWRSDPGDNPYAPGAGLEYHPAWTGSLFREIGFVVRVLGQDTHDELAAAWAAIQVAPEPRRGRALAALEDVTPLSYDRVTGEIHARLNAKDRTEELRLSTELTKQFRAQYERARRIAEDRE